MGTSSPYKGLKGNNPLLPSWLPTQEQPSNQPQQSESQTSQPTQTGPDQRFSGSRGAFSRFIRSGGQDRKNLGRAVSRYVSRSSGGARTAAQRMGSSRVASERLLGFLSSSRSQGLSQTLRERNLGHLIGRPLEEVFAGLTDYICPDEGTIDAGIARDAFIETITELAQNGISDLEQLTFEQMLTVFELYSTNAIEARLFNDVGLKTIVLAGTVQEIDQIQRQLRDFIRRSVSDAITEVQGDADSLTPEQMSGFVNTAYQQAFTILQTLGEQEANA